MNQFSCKSVLPLFIFIAGITSCEKFVTIDPPPTQIEAGIIFENDQAAISAATSLYSRMAQTNLNNMNGGATLYPALSADELYNTATNSDYDMFTTNSLVVNNGSGITRLWKTAYATIYQANAVLEGIAGSRSMSDSVKNMLRGEMLFVRAINFFYLVNHFGEVPYTATTDYRVNQSLPRTPVNEVYQNLLADLKEAKNLLKETYASAERARPNKWTAAALLARIYLYRKEFINAEMEATAVIQSGRYSLVAFPANAFAPASTETIWQMPRSNANTAEGATFLPSSATTKPPFAATASLLNTFESGDKRRLNWLNKNTVTGTDYYYPYKYKVRVITPVTEYYVVLRLAEQYLIRAEARAMQNNMTGAKADIDMIRSRAGVSNTIAATQPALLTAIEKERQAELFAEWGHRWLDMIRLGKADAVFGPLKSPNWQPTDVLYPIPLSEIQTNPFLIQNPGY